MSYETEKALLSVYRVEVTEHRNGETRPVKLIPCETESAARQTFEGLAIRELKHFFNNWTFGAFETFTTFELYIEDKQSDIITIKAGGVNE